MKELALLGCPCVLFDFDGTLVDSNGEVIRRMRLFMEQEGLVEDEGFFERLKTMGPGPSAQYFSQLCRGKYTPQEIAHIFEKGMSQFYLEQVQPKPGVCEYVAALHRRGVRLGVASCSQEPEITGALGRIGILDYFDFFATPATTGVGSKSDPNFFLRAAEMFPQRQMEAIGLYDDAYDALAVAKGLGMRTAAVQDVDNRRLTEKLTALCDIYVPSYGELLVRLKRFWME